MPQAIMSMTTRTVIVIVHTIIVMSIVVLIFTVPTAGGM